MNRARSTGRTEGDPPSAGAGETVEHLVVGAGPVGTATALALAESGDRVRVVTRSGSGPGHPLISLIPADAADGGRLADLAAGAATVFNCANPPYHRWARDWPPLASSMLGAAERAGAVLVTMSNLYGYGPVDGPMTTDTPLAATETKGRVRAEMWRQALEAHENGRVRVAEARASDFIGRGLGPANNMGSRVTDRVARGRGVRVIGRSDVAHSWTYVGDVARTLVTLARSEEAWGRAWHVPSGPPLTQEELVVAMCRAAGVDRVPVGTVPRALLRVVGLFQPKVREVLRIAYQFERPFVMDSRATTEAFGLEAMPLDEVLDEVFRGVPRGSGIASRG
ncbi:MAG TPA: NAD-dependent epimerase/dehydratase family protein [Acidimicrobiales bacterium]|nr:NAD-dependent epimerase/dehydratase family protein [Acidimicrobiales bacterium]